MKTWPLKQLESFCRRFPTRFKGLLVPNRQIGSHLVDSLVQSGYNVINLRVFAVLDLLKFAAYRDLNAPSEIAIPSEVDRWLLEFILEESFRANPDGYFSSLPVTAGLTESFQNTLLELNAAGIEADTLANFSNLKVRAVADVLARHRSLLAEKKVTNQPGLAWKALRRLSSNDHVPRFPMAVMDETVLTLPEKEVVEGVSGGDWFRIGLPRYSVPVPEQSAAHWWPNPEKIIDRDVVISPAGKLASGEDIAPLEVDIRLEGALGAEYEVTAAFRQMIHQGIPVDAVEIVYTNYDKYVPLLAGAAERLGLPATFSEGKPFRGTSFGRLVTGVLDWITNDYPLSGLVGLLRTGLIENPVSNGECIEAHRLASFLMRARIGDGLDAIRTAGRGGASFRDLLDSEAEIIRSWLGSVYEMTPKGKVSLEAFSDKLVRLAKHFRPGSFPPPKNLNASNEDHADYEVEYEGMVFRKNLDDLSLIALADQETKVWANRLNKRFGSLKVDNHPARPGQVHVSPLDRAGYTGRGTIFLLGMDEGAFPGNATENPVLLDHERAEISGSLKKFAGTPVKNTWQMMRLLSSVPGKVVLFSRIRDALTGSEVYPSPLFHHLMERTGVKMENLSRFGPIPDQNTAIDKNEWGFGNRKAVGAASEVYHRFKWLNAGATAADARLSWDRPEFRGVLDHPAADLAIEAQRAVSASAIETLTACPYQYFLKYVLGVSPPDEPEPDPSRWLDHREFGSALHEVLCRFMRNLHRTGEKPRADVHKTLMNETVAEVVGQKTQMIKVPNQAAFDADVQKLKIAAGIFLEEESGRENVEPFDFEVAFGYGGGAGDPEDVAPVPVELSPEVSLHLRGRIDRVDKSDGQYQIWDYKTGSANGFSQDDLGSGAQKMQWALYAVAFEELMARKGNPVRVETSGYFFPSTKENGLRLGGGMPSRADLADRLKPFFDLVRRGFFLRLQKESACSYCDYKAVCDGEQIKASYGKLPVDINDESLPFFDEVTSWNQV